MRKIPSPICARLLPNEIHERRDSPVTARRTPNSASLKKIRPAYRIATNRLLFDRDDSASMAADTIVASTNEKRVIAGKRYRLAARNVKLPANETCPNNST